MSDDPKFHAAIECEVVWKDAEVRRFAVELVERALNSCEPKFTTDIVPDKLRGTGTGIAGSVVQILKTAHVIEPVGVTVAGKFYPDKVISQREGRNSSPIGVYRLVSVNIAREFLRRNSSRVAAPVQQPEFFAPASNAAAAFA